MRKFLFRIGVGLPILLLASTASGEVLFEDSFDGTRLDSAVWEVPTPFLGRTQMRAGEPTVSGGFCRLSLDTYNPTANSPGDSFYGSEIRTRSVFSRGSGLIVEARTRLVAPAAGGLVGSVFTYMNDIGGVDQRDEIDFELLGNDVVGGKPRVLTNSFDDDDFNEAGAFQFADIPGLVLTDFNVWRIEWLPDRVRWLVNGVLVREEFSRVPDENQRLHFNIWAPDSTFSSAFDERLQPVADAAQNSSYFYDVDYVRVMSVGSSDSWSSYYDVAYSAYTAYASYDPEYALALYYYYLAFGDFAFYLEGRHDPAYATYRFYEDLGAFFLYFYRGGNYGWYSYYLYVATAYYHYFATLGDAGSASDYYWTFYRVAVELL